ncbi:sugar phosphate isomerase/epimerase family protein [Flavivirga eckloniae]|uniref:Endonuclease n=1 Tax=Flavivirga eckloniae TaxID=1803846 RepID=A0A2K9PNQ3_9FLAO|nr:sugar phosphate isomerase/epimerase family protein [Flavivirga eckloniae]AUP78689.1 endonuclease [Flavivirga eckloniae]
MNKTRRDFIRQAAIAAGVIPFLGFRLPLDLVDMDEKLDVSIFSKHLQFLDYRETGEMAATMGFSGVDLTVRPKGHVLPERVGKDLPKAIAEITEGGSSCHMITTNIKSVNNRLDVDVLEAASKLAVKYYRANWYKFTKEASMLDTLKKCQQEIKALGDLNKKLGIIGCYQNHAGTGVGSSFWEVKEILDAVNPDYFGVQYDIRHAVVEGGYSWKNGLKLLQPHIKTIVLKDFKWTKTNGKWKIVNTPIGEGMVNFDAYFKLLKQYRLKPPVSLHLEYPLGGAEHGKTNIAVDKKVVFDAMKKDLNSIQKLWKAA